MIVGLSPHCGTVFALVYYLRLLSPMVSAQNHTRPRPESRLTLSSSVRLRANPNATELSSTRPDVSVAKPPNKFNGRKGVLSGIPIPNFRSPNSFGDLLSDHDLRNPTNVNLETALVSIQSGNGKRQLGISAQTGQALPPPSGTVASVVTASLSANSSNSSLQRSNGNTNQLPFGAGDDSQNSGQIGTHGYGIDPYNNPQVNPLLRYENSQSGLAGTRTSSSLGYQSNDVPKDSAAATEIQNTQPVQIPYGNNLDINLPSQFPVGPVSGYGGSSVRQASSPYSSPPQGSYQSMANRGYSNGNDFARGNMQRPYAQSSSSSYMIPSSGQSASTGMSYGSSGTDSISRPYGSVNQVRPATSLGQLTYGGASATGQAQLTAARDYGNRNSQQLSTSGGYAVGTIDSSAGYGTGSGVLGGESGGNGGGSNTGNQINSYGRVTGTDRTYAGNINVGSGYAAAGLPQSNTGQYNNGAAAYQVGSAMGPGQNLDNVRRNEPPPQNMYGSGQTQQQPSYNTGNWNSLPSSQPNYGVPDRPQTSTFTQSSSGYGLSSNQMGNGPLAGNQLTGVLKDLTLARNAGMRTSDGNGVQSSAGSGDPTRSNVGEQFADMGHLQEPNRPAEVVGQSANSAINHAINSEPFAQTFTEPLLQSNHGDINQMSHEVIGTQTFQNFQQQVNRPAVDNQIQGSQSRMRSKPNVDVEKVLSPDTPLQQSPEGHHDLQTTGTSTPLSGFGQLTALASSIQRQLGATKRRMATTLGDDAVPSMGFPVITPIRTKT